MSWVRRSWKFRESKFSKDSSACSTTGLIRCHVSTYILSLSGMRRASTRRSSSAKWSCLLHPQHIAYYGGRVPLDYVLSSLHSMCLESMHHLQTMRITYFGETLTKWFVYSSCNWGSKLNTHPQPLHSSLRIFRLQPGLERKLLLRRTCSGQKLFPLRFPGLSLP